MTTPKDTRSNARQSELLNFIATYQQEQGGVSPSYRECAAALRVKSIGQVCTLLNALEKRGFVRRLRGRTRAIEIVSMEASEANSLIYHWVGYTEKYGDIWSYPKPFRLEVVRGDQS